MLAVGLTEAGRIDDAIEHFRLAQRLDPDSPFTKNALAWLLATREKSSEQERREALELATAAAEATRFRQPQLLDTLAAALASAGQYDQAVAVAERAIGIAQRANDEKLVAKIRQRLALYQRRQPYYLSGDE